MVAYIYIVDDIHLHIYIYGGLYIDDIHVHIYLAAYIYIYIYDIYMYNVHIFLVAGAIGVTRLRKHHSFVYIISLNFIYLCHFHSASH